MVHRRIKHRSRLIRQATMMATAGTWADRGASPETIRDELHEMIGAMVRQGPVEPVDWMGSTSLTPPGLDRSDLHPFVVGDGLDWIGGLL